MRRLGVHWQLAQRTVETLRNVQFYAKTRDEHALENHMVACLRHDPKLTTHVLSQLDGDPVEKIEQARIFGFRLRPDAAIGRDGTAIELKMVRGASGFRNALGQALVYRMEYRFVVLCLVDRTAQGRFSSFAADPDRAGHKMLQSMAADLGIFSVIAPHPRAKQKQNVALIV